MASKISVKLLVDTKSNKVLFAEAGKEFVDFLVSLLILPVGAVAKLVSAGSIGRLRQSVDHIGASYFLPGTDKSGLLRPRVLRPDARELLLFQGCDGKSPQRKQRLYTCASGDCATATVETNATCPRCWQPMSTEVACFSLLMSTPAGRQGDVEGASSEDSGGAGYVKGLITYMVTDGLEVTPMAAVSITLINKLGVGGGMEVELVEKNVSLDRDEGQALLKAALHSDTVLTDVFLARNNK